MKNARSKLSSTDKARMYLAVAMASDALGDTAKADQYFDRAAQTVTPTSKLTIKDIYERHILSLYRRGEPLKMKRVVSKAMRSMKGWEKPLKTRVAFFGELSNPTREKKTLRSFLTRDDLNFRAGEIWNSWQCLVRLF